jgi:hypothetical protein
VAGTKQYLASDSTRPLCFFSSLSGPARHPIPACAAGCSSRIRDIAAVDDEFHSSVGAIFFLRFSYETEQL